MTADKTLPLFEPNDNSKHEHILMFQHEASPELIPCPLCGNDRVGLYYWHCFCGIGGFAVICWHCHMKSSVLPVSNETAEKAVEVWNGNSIASLPGE